MTVGLALVPVVAVVAAYLAWVLWRNRRAGVLGLVRRVQLRCPKCHGTFDYAFVPGASLRAVRLGRRRYLPCPLCHRWSVIPLGEAPPAPSSAGEVAPASPR